MGKTKKKDANILKKILEIQKKQLKSTPEKVMVLAKEISRLVNQMEN